MNTEQNVEQESELQQKQHNPQEQEIQQDIKQEVKQEQEQQIQPEQSQSEPPTQPELPVEPVQEQSIASMETEPIASEQTKNEIEPTPMLEPTLDVESTVKEVESVNSAVESALPTDTVKMEVDGLDEPVQIKAESDAPANGVKRHRADRKMVVVPPTAPQLFYTPLKTGLVYDVRMRYHAKIFTLYFEYIDPHPEDPRRIYRIYKKLAEAGLVQDASLAGADDIGPLMVKIPIREATADEILAVHSREHLAFIALTESMSRDQLLEETERGDSIYVNNDSFLLAKLSCGGTIEACKAVIEGRVKNAMAVVRPPGHHAEPDSPGGFCLFSNVAVAAKNLLRAYPELVRRIVIVDWDIHHGNGTQRAFYDDPRVLYISVHRYENGKFYPGTKYGAHTNVGSGPGEGFSLNIPWRAAARTDGDYIYAFQRVILPVISEFDPDLVIVSSGFDAADGDIIGGCHVTPAGYGHLTHMLKSAARGKLAVILEGGYNLDSISKSALGVAKVLVGEPPDKVASSLPQLDTIEVVDEVVKVQAKYWKCMRPGNPQNSFDDLMDSPVVGTDFARNADGTAQPSDTPAQALTAVGDPVRAQQAQDLFAKYGFINLPVLAPADEKHPLFSLDLPSLDDVVVASPDIYHSQSVVIAVHDPPEIWANVNPVNGNIDPSSSMVLSHPLAQLIDRVQKEVDPSDEKTVGYIDINIPSFLPNPRSTTPSSYNPTIFAQELLLYLWDNYISYFSLVKKIVFVGFGDAYQSIVHLYAKRPSPEIKELVKGTVVFVNRSPLKPLVPVMDESMVDWYYKNSVVFTSCLNPCWTSTSQDDSKRPRRKFGRVIKASVDGLWDVISERFDEGMDFVLDSVEDFSGSDSSS